MRIILTAVALAALAACNRQETAAPAAQQQATTNEAGKPDPIVLSGNAIARSGEQLAFGAPRDRADGLVAQAGVTGPENSANDECGAGPMEFSRHPGGLTLNYQDGKLVGWLLDERSDTVTVEGGLAIGAGRTVAEALPGFAPVDGSTLGDEFYSESRGIGGFLEEDRVSLLYAGTNCFFR